MPISYGILAFRKIPEERIEKCLVRPLNMPECKICLDKLNKENRFLHPLVDRTIEKGQVQLLCILRRDTHALVDLLRGRHKEEMLSVWLREITCMEKFWLQNMSFEKIWNMMFRRRPSGQQEQLHANLVVRSKAQTHQDGHFPYAEFGIPKGRIDKKDKTYMGCAIREFEEETNYRAKDLDFGKPPYATFIEDFIGTNGIAYTHVYFIAHIDADIPIPEMTVHQLGEIQNVGWFKQEEILSVLRPYDYAKKDVIQRTFIAYENFVPHLSSPRTDTKG